MSQSTTAETAKPIEERSEPTGGLIFFVRGLDILYTSEAAYNSIALLLKELLPGREWDSFDYISTYWSVADPDDEAEKLEKKLAESSANYKDLY
jgi:hypothetical protein